MKKIIYNDTSYQTVKNYIETGDFWFCGRLFFIAKTENCVNLYEVINKKSVLVLKVYPEEDLHKTILKYIGYDLLTVERQKEEQAKAIQEKNDDWKRKKIIIQRMHLLGVKQLDIVCYLRKSIYSMSSEDIDRLEDVAKKLESGELSLRKVFPIANRSLKNYHFNIKGMYPNAKIKRVIHDNIKVQNDLVFCLFLVYMVPVLLIFLYFTLYLRGVK